MYERDPWPCAADGEEYDGEDVIEMIKKGQSPLPWDVDLLVRDVEGNLKLKITDMPMVYQGANHYGFHFSVLQGGEVLARLDRSDVNMPDYEDFPKERLVLETEFEADTYSLLRNVPEIRVSRLLYHRIPVLHPNAGQAVPSDILGRALLVFQKAPGEKEVWNELTPQHRCILLDQLAQLRAALFQLDLPFTFSTKHLHRRIPPWMPKESDMPVAPTREFWMHAMELKIHATIKNLGAMIGWPDDDETVGPTALAAKHTLLRITPHVFPPDTEGLSLYRFVLEHDDFGIQNMTVATGDDGGPLITSLYDWETGCIVPALFSDPLAVVTVNLTADEGAEPCVTRAEDYGSAEYREEFAGWARHYIKELFGKAPNYKEVIQAAKDARHLWFALKHWHGGDSEQFFGELGAWAEQRLKDMGVQS